VIRLNRKKFIIYIWTKVLTAADIHFSSSPDTRFHLRVPYHTFRARFFLLSSCHLSSALIFSCNRAVSMLSPSLLNPFAMLCFETDSSNNAFIVKEKIEKEQESTTRIIVSFLFLQQLLAIFFRNRSGWKISIKLIFHRIDTYYTNRFWIGMLFLSFVFACDVQWQRWINLSNKAEYDNPDACQSWGTLLIDVKPGMVLISFKNILFAFFVTRKSTRAIPATSKARNAISA